MSTEPNPSFERALTVLADSVADLRAAEQRCIEVDARSLAIEHQVGADAVRLSMVSVLADYLSADRMTAAVLDRVDVLIAEAVVRRDAR